MVEDDVVNKWFRSEMNGDDVKWDCEYNMVFLWNLFVDVI